MTRKILQSQVVAPQQLTDRQLEQWLKICRQNPHLDSAYFRPEWALDVAAVRDDVRVLCVEHDEAGPAFWTYQQRGATARPTGGRLSDYQGIVAPAGHPVTASELLSAGGLRCYHFDHLVDPEGRFASWVSYTDQSPVADLSQGFAAYREMNAQGSRELKETMRKRRKLEREGGRIEFVADDTSAAAWESLLAWKSAQYQASNITNVVSFEWVQQLLQRVRERNEGDCRGLLSSLYVDGKVLAVHLGLLCDGVLHYWLPTYQAGELAARCSPGRVLLLELCEAADTIPLKKIDFGRGVSRQKRSAMTGATDVHVGAADYRVIRRLGRNTWHKTYDWLKQSPLKHPLKLPARLLYRLREWLAFR